LYKVSNSWAEDTLTWNNKPTLGSHVASIGSSATGTWLNIDVTAYVKSGTAASFALVPKTGNGVAIPSKEASANRPRLAVVGDSSAPTTPTGVSATAGSSSTVDLTWKASTDDVGVVKYKVYRDDAIVGSPSGTSFEDSGLSAGKSYSYEVSALDAAGNESAKSAPVTVTTPSSGKLGIAYGPYNMFASTSSLEPNTDVFSGGLVGVTPSSIAAVLNTARTNGLSVMITMTGGGHFNYMSDLNGGTCDQTEYKNDQCIFDMARWKSFMDGFNTTTIKDLVSKAVADGVIVGNSVMDEPHVHWGLGGDGNNWGPSGTLTKVRVDELCGYVKKYFPSMPVGVAHQHYIFEPQNSYKVCEFIIDQYSWRSSVKNADGSFSPGNGNVDQYIADAKAQAQKEGIALAFSMNILNGGVQDKDGTYDCAGTGGTGTYAPNCRMTPTQVEEWGKKLGVTGCFMTMWRYDSTFMSKSTNQAAFEAVADKLAATPWKSCHRP
jgi:hypothetical protein